MEPISPVLVPDPAKLVRAGDDAAAARLLRQWIDAAERTADPAIAGFARDLADDRAGRGLLSAIFGNSPYLGQMLVGDVGFARDLVVRGPDPACAETLAALRADAGDGEDTAGMMRRLRIAKRRFALTTAIADITAAWPLERVTAALSEFAEAALRAAAAHLLRQAARRGEFASRCPADPERESGFIVLGMGKLGARDLNYSSDIDLIVLYERERIEYTGPRTVEECFVRLTRELVRMLEERTQDGYVFRIDLRLRPDPRSTPPAISTLAAETYYESAGQNWERAAMIKARPVAGDLAAGERFLELLRPYVWRKHLDFAAIADIHSIKRQINAHRGGGDIAIAGHDVKLGRGGIREIEFFAQTQQLIWGGRDATLRAQGTCEALDALARVGHVDRHVVERLQQAYRFLRRVEHRLQMVDDRQTHSLPTDDGALAGLAAFMGFDDRRSFCDALVNELRTVERHYAELFEESPDLSRPGNLVFTGGEDDPDTLETLSRLGFRDPRLVAATVRGWHHGRYRATRSARAREILTELIPSLLESLAGTIDSNAALIRFDEFLRGLPAGVQLFSLFQNNPGLLDLVAEIMGSAPRLAEGLSRHPILLDGVLTQGFFDHLPDAGALAAEMEEQLAQARNFEDVLDSVRRLTNDRIFQIGVHILRGKCDPESAGRPLSDIADAGLRALAPAVEADVIARHGTMPGGGFAVVAFGKLGGREMTVESDLDLLFVYDAPDAVSDGPKPLAPAHFYARQSQRFINAITAPTGEGKLYEVDMRLRPSGNAGPIATGLQAFLQYQRENAWTWEHMALTRARVVWAPADLARRLDEAIRSVLTAPRDVRKLLCDVADMRARMAREHGADDMWAIKSYRGGLIDVEFIAQYLQLRYAADHADVLSTNTTDALARLAEAGVLSGAVADELIGAMRLWRNLQGMLRMSAGRGFDESRAPEGLRTTLARACGAPTFDALKAQVETTARCVYGHFVDLIEAPAAREADAAPA